MGSGTGDAALDERARALHEQAIVIDCLDVSQHDERHWRNMRAGGVTAANVTITVSADFKDTCKLIADFNNRVAAHPDLVRPVRTVDDILAAKREGRVGMIYGFQNACPIENDLRFIQLFRDMGVRIVQLTYMAANLLGDGCLEPRNGGLTKFGAAVVKELNRCGMLIDLSHVGHRTTMDAIASSAQPVAITHACARALCRSPRNKEDEAIKALAERGGVMGITSLASFVSDDWREADLARFCDHIDYVANLVGIDHVGLGMDFTENMPVDFLVPVNWGGTQCQPERPTVTPLPYPYARGIANAAEFPNVTRELLRRGYSDTDVEKVLGGNWLRLFRQVWEAGTT
jgi:membrane dipeptidase